MADVTFGVKVSEEMKNELSLLMKEHTLSGKEFMSMLLASYKLDQSKDESKMYESDIIELQTLVKRIQNIFFNMTEKSKTCYVEEKSALEKVIEAQKSEKDELVAENQKLKEALEQSKVRELEIKKTEEALRKEIEQLQKEKKLQKVQLENNLLLHKKFEEEVEKLKEKIDSLQRLEVEIEERNNENTKLKVRNDELASEVWFLQRDAEKQEKEKETIKQNHEMEIVHLNEQHQLQLKNELLEQKLSLSEKEAQLKEEIMKIKEEKSLWEKKYYEQEHKKSENIEEKSK